MVLIVGEWLIEVVMEAAVAGLMKVVMVGLLVDW